MKKTLTIILIITALTGFALAAPNTATTNYFTNSTYVAAAAAWTNSYATGALVFPIAEIGTLTATQATGDVREVIAQMLNYTRDQEVTKALSTNSLTYFGISIETNNISTYKRWNWAVWLKRSATAYTNPSE